VYVGWIFVLGKKITNIERLILEEFVCLTIGLESRGFGRKLCNVIRYKQLDAFCTTPSDFKIEKFPYKKHPNLSDKISKFGIRKALVTRQ